jgi:hypothetical protein
VGHDPGIVDNHVDTAMVVDGVLNEPLHVGQTGHVGLDGCRVAERELGCELSQSLQTPRAENQRGAVAGQLARRGFAKAAARPGDDDDLAGDYFESLRGEGGKWESAVENTLEAGARVTPDHVHVGRIH